jgi:hypothetical protein
MATVAFVDAQFSVPVKFKAELICIVPAFNVTFPAPNALVVVVTSVPLLRTVGPVKVLTPETVSVPSPFFVIPPAPLKVPPSTALCPVSTLKIALFSVIAPERVPPDWNRTLYKLIALVTVPLVLKMVRELVPF